MHVAIKFNTCIMFWFNLFKCIIVNPYLIHACHLHWPNKTNPSFPSSYHRVCKLICSRSNKIIIGNLQLCSTWYLQHCGKWNTSWQNGKKKETSVSKHPSHKYLVHFKIQKVCEKTLKHMHNIKENPWRVLSPWTAANREKFASQK